ncbi:MAG: ATP-binding protein [Caldilineaceae bacterium]
MMSDIQTLPIFVDVTDDEMTWLIANSSEVTVPKGDYFFREGEAARHFYIVIEGELQVTRTLNGEQIVLGTTPRGIIGGELWLLRGTPIEASAQAIVPTRLMVFEFRSFLGIFANCPSVGVHILRVAAERMSNFATLVKQQEKMAALGKLSAGLAHELNNPAAAARRSASTLRGALAAWQSHTFAIAGLGLTADQVNQLLAFLHLLQSRAATLSPLSPLEQSDREMVMEDWLNEQAVNNAWEIAPIYVTAGVTIDELQPLVAMMPTAKPTLLVWLCEWLTASGLLDEIEQSARRISELVSAIKSYTYMDQGKWQDVDIHHDLDNTLLILKHKLKNIQVERNFCSDLPRIAARGSELNQVWTNLIDNAVDAMNGNGTLALITRYENNFVMVEITDTGPGVPAHVLPHIFEPFFTTKEVGKGTGLGLDITYRIIQQHRGTIEVQSKPGQTRFIVRLPLQQESQ